MPLGLPWRTRNSMVEVVGAASCGKRRAQSLATTPLSARNCTSVEVFIVTTSAARPSLTARAWGLEPACGWSILMSWALAFFVCVVLFFVFFVVGEDRGFVVLVKLARHVVRDIEQCAVRQCQAAGGQGQRGQKGLGSQRGHGCSA